MNAHTHARARGLSVTARLTLRPASGLPDPAWKADPVALAFQPLLGPMLASAYTKGGRTDEVRCVCVCVEGCKWVWMREGA